jgi:hypothetical protein
MLRLPVSDFLIALASGFLPGADAIVNRRFEMYEVRQVIAHLRLGGTDGEIARPQRISMQQLGVRFREVSMTVMGQ